MEITVYPRAFTVAPSSIDGPDGKIPVMLVTLLDIAGTIVKVPMGLKDWEGFKHAVADPEGFAARQREEHAAAEARQRIVLAGSPIGPQRGSKKPH